MPLNKSNLVADLKEMLLVALELGDHAKVQKFAGYLAELSGEKGAPKAEKKLAAKRGPKPKAKEEEAPPKPAQTSKAKKSTKVKKATKRGAAKFPVGTKLTVNYKGTLYTVEVKGDGYEYEGELFSSLSRLANKAFGVGKAAHLRNFANWKVAV